MRRRPGAAAVPFVPPISRPGLRIALYYSALFGMVGVVMPFYPVWLASRGLDPAEIGMVFAATLWVRILSNPVAAGIADRRGERKRVMLVLSGIATLVALLFLPSYGFWPILAVAILHTAFHAPVNPVGENLVLLTARERGLDYGRMRLWGSVAFIATSSGAGLLLTSRPEDLIMILIIGLMATTWATILFLPDPRPPRVEPGRRPTRALLGNGEFRLCILAAGLVMASHAVLNGFATIHWRAAGLGDGVIGMLWAGGVVAEIALFAASARLADRIGIGGLLALGAAAGVVRWIGTAQTTDIAALAGLQALHAFTFGAAHLGAMRYIQTRIPPQLSATAQGLYSSLTMGIGVGLAAMASGHLYEALAGDAFLVMAGLAAAGLGASLLLARRLA